MSISGDAVHLPVAGRRQHRRRKDARPAELVAAALDLFVEKGFAATRLEDVAARAGVSKGTLYLYFDGKEALFKAVIEDGMVPLFEAAEARLSDYRGSASELLALFLRTMWERIGNTRLAGVFKLIVAESNNFPELTRYYHDEVILRARALMRTLLQRGVESGEFRSIDIEQTIRVVFAPLLWLAVWRFSPSSWDDDCDAEAYLQAHIEIVVRGLRAPTGIISC